MSITYPSPEIDHASRDQERTEKALIQDMLSNKGEWVSQEYFYRWRSQQAKAISLLSIEDRLTDAEYWEIVGKSYTQSKGMMWRDKNIWLYLFTDPRADRHHLMSPEEYAAFIALPDPVQLFRGVNLQCEGLSPADVGKYARGMSWTLSLRKAERFATMFGGTNRVIFTASVPKGKLLAYFSGRGNAEVVVDPRRIKVTPIVAAVSDADVSGGLRVMRRSPVS